MTVPENPPVSDRLAIAMAALANQIELALDQPDPATKAYAASLRSLAASCETIRAQLRAYPPMGHYTDRGGAE
jgi:hypothetical protein